MVPASVLVALVLLVGSIPMPPPPARRRGRPCVYPDRLFLKALVIMIVRHLPTVHVLVAALDESTPEMQQLRALLTRNGRYPSGRTWERRLAAIRATLPAQIGCLGRELVRVLDPWLDCARAAAIDSTTLRAFGGYVWHKRDREAGIVLHTGIDTEAGWTKSGWHGWVYGWKLHVVCTVARGWIPLAATLTPADVGDNAEAPALLAEVTAELRFLLGDQSYRDQALTTICAARDCFLVVPKGGAYPHRDDGRDVRALLH